MAVKHELAERDYILGMSYVDIAEKHGVSLNTVKSWKKRHGWERDKAAKKTVKITAPFAPLKNKKGCTPEKRMQEQEELSDQEQLFCYHYVRTWNATQAALKAGYGNGNKASANVLGCRLMARPRVAIEIKRLKEIMTQGLHIDATDILQQYINIAFADIGDYVSFKGRSVVLGDSELLDTSVLTEVKEGKDGLSIKLADKMKALEKLELYFDLLPEQWKRKMETEKLDIERQKLDILRQRNGDGEGNEGMVQFVDDIGDDDADD